MVQSLFPNQITYRRSTGAAATLNPPSVNHPVVDAATLTGAVTISIHVDLAGNGRLLAGDTFTIAGDPTVYTVGGPVPVTVVGTGASADTQFANVPIAPALQHDAARGAAVTFTFLADSTVNAQIVGFPADMINGTSVMVNDLKINIPAANITFTPGPNDKLIVSGSVQAVVYSRPRYFAGALAHWEFQAR